MRIDGSHDSNAPALDICLSRHSFTHYGILPTLVSVLTFSVSFHAMPLLHTLTELALGAVALTMFVIARHSCRDPIRSMRCEFKKSSWFSVSGSD